MKGLFALSLIYGSERLAAYAVILRLSRNYVGQEDLARSRLETQCHSTENPIITGRSLARCDLKKLQQRLHKQTQYFNFVRSTLPAAHILP
jgi:hypothetical protein